MKYNFHAPPFIFYAPGDIYKTRKFIGGTNEGWLDYTPELWEEISKQWEASKTTVRLLVEEEEVYNIPSNSDPSKSYIVKKSGRGEWTCSCPGFGFRRKCKHIDSVKNKGK